jgi:hypothetical protein
MARRSLSASSGVKPAATRNPHRLFLKERHAEGMQDKTPVIGDRQHHYEGTLDEVEGGAGQVGSDRSAEQTNESWERERAGARERSARPYAAKKARLAPERAGIEI